MSTRILLILTLSLLLPTYPVLSQENPHQKAHGDVIFSRFLLEGGPGINDSGHGMADWDLDGWIGTDENKLWLKSEGEYSDSTIEHAEFIALYSRNVDKFWDAQIGIRHDTRPTALTYLVLGMEGLAPYFFETAFHGFVSEDGDISLRLRQENDLLLTQRLILQPYLEVEVFLQNVPARHIGSGLAHAELGLQFRYEYTRKFAPYIDVQYRRKFGRTASIAGTIGEDNDEIVTSIGLRLMF